MKQQSSVNGDEYLAFDFGGFELAHFDCEFPTHDDVIGRDPG